MDPVLLDVSRLIWRRWTRRLPTGIDRVCLAYLRHFGPHAVAVIQFHRFRMALDGRDSVRLFNLLSGSQRHFRLRLLFLLLWTARTTGRLPAGLFYVNAGHTGLDSSSLGQWLAARRLRPIFFVHDLIPITHPQYCRDGEDRRHARRMINALASASGIITNSATTRDQLADFAGRHGLPFPPTTVAWLGVDPGAHPSPEAPPARPYFLMVGTIEGRKNHRLILRAWQTMMIARCGAPPPELLIAGQRGWKADDVIERLDRPGMLEGHVRELGRCDDETLDRLLAGARAVLMPSKAEGFGLPVAEALRAGTPAIASDLEAFREIAGDIPDYLDPDDVDGWIRAIDAYSTDGPERGRQLKRIKSFRPPRWADHFANVERLLASLA